MTFPLAGFNSEVCPKDVQNYRWKRGGSTIYFAESEDRDWGDSFIPGDYQLPSRPATDIRLTVVVQDPRISQHHLLSLAVKVGPVLEAQCGTETEFDGSGTLVSMASISYKYQSHAFLFWKKLVLQGYKVMIGTANVDGEPNGLQCGSTEGLKCEMIEIPAPQSKFQSNSGSASCATINGSLNQAPKLDPDLVVDRSLRLLVKVDVRLQHLFPLMPGFLFQRIMRKQAQLVNKLERLTVEHAQHAFLGTCSSGKHCSYRGTLSSFSSNVLEPPAKHFPAIVECLVCFKTQVLHTLTDWTDHLYADVKPYFCTAYPCRNTIKFSSKQDWLRHEKENCQKQYWRCDVGKCTTMWVAQTDFKTHLVKDHSLAEDDKLDSIQQRCGHDFHRKKKTCFFCGLRGHDDLDTHVAQHMVEICKYVLQVVKQQEIAPQPIIDQGEADQKNSTFSSIQSHPPTFSQNDIARTVLDENVKIPPLQPFESAQSTAVSYEESLRSTLAIECEQPDGSLLHPLGGSSNQHLQSQGAHHGGTSVPISIPESAPLGRWYNSSIVYKIGPNLLFDRPQSGTLDTPFAGQTTYGTSSHSTG